MKRILNVGRYFSAVLGMMAVLAPPITRMPKAHYYMVGLGVLLMIGVGIQLVRKKYEFTTALSMSIAGLSAGACAGFSLAWIFTGKSEQMMLTLKWLIGAVVLNGMFRYELNGLEQPRESEAFTTNYALPDNYADFNDEQREEVKRRMEEEISRMEEYIESTKLQNRKRMLLLLPLLAVAAAFTIWSAVVK